MIAVAGSEDKLEFCTRYGADHVVNYRIGDLTGRITKITDRRGVDLIYDPVGGDTAATALKSLARNGRIAMMGLASGAPVPIDPMDMDPAELHGRRRVRHARITGMFDSRCSMRSSSLVAVWRPSGVRLYSTCGEGHWLSHRPWSC